MDREKAGNSFTVQGGDTPVPVRGLSGRAGSPGPLASDRSAPPAGSQAGGGYTATGETGGLIGGAEGFVKKGIPRSPTPQRSRVNSLPDRTSCLTPGEIKTASRKGIEDQRQSDSEVFSADSEGSGTLETTKKRKGRTSCSPLRRGQGTLQFKKVRNEKEEENQEERISTDMGKIIARLKDAAAEMGDLVKKNPNTKVELKKLISEFEATSELLSRKSQKLFGGLRHIMEGRTHGADSRRTEGGAEKTESHEGPSREELLVRLARADEETRRLREENDFLTTEVRELRGREELVTDHMLRDKRTFEEFSELEKLEWPGNVFKAVFFAAGSPLVSKPNTDHLVIYEEGRNQKGSEGVKKAFEERFPELREAEEGIGTIKISTRFLTRDGVENVKERWIVRTEAGDDDSVWFESLARAKAILQEGNRKEVAVYPPGSDIKGIKTRKMLEFIFRGSGIKCHLHIKAAQTDSGVKGEGTRPRGRRPEALVVSQEGKTYSDLLKVIRDKIKPDSEAAKAVRTIREARDGKKMVIILDKAEGTAMEQLKGEIEKLEDVSIRKSIRREEETVFIQDIDELTSKEDVTREVCKVTGLACEQVTVSELRKGYGGNRAATVRLPREKAAEVCSKERLRIGLNWCPVKERVEVTRCYRCWKYGHLGRECREEKDDSKLCRKCGGVGHMAADCARRDWCLTCKVEGHTAGSGVCPEFRKAVARERKARNRRRGY